MTAKIGISHVLPFNAEIIHSTLIGKNAFGRITDCIAFWCKQERNLDQVFLGDLRVLAQALMEFSSLGDGSPFGQIEVANTDHVIIIATRFEMKRKVNPAAFEKELAQYWVNSEEVKLFKKVLYPHDRVEARYHLKLNLIEWRVHRSTRSGEVVDHNSSFAVFIDDSNDIQGGTSRYTDLGDLPFQKWLAEVYQTRPNASRSGEVSSNGEPSQDEAEWARVVVEREKVEIENILAVADGRPGGDVPDNLPLDPALSDRENHEDDSSHHFSDERIKELLAEQVDLKDSIRDFVLEIKKRELRGSRKINTLLKKIQQFEVLLRRKELINQRAQTERKVLHEKLEAERKKKKSEKGENFREKALKMFEMLKRVKEENQTLEKMMIEIRQRERELADRPIDSASQKIVDETNKKFEKVVRALDSEKLKVKSLFDRVTSAEKEAQGSGSLLKDLETKVEHAMKLAHQHKKETEGVKQKLVQADAEKNKVKNELAKAQAQIQTLMKRSVA